MNNLEKDSLCAFVNKMGDRLLSVASMIVLLLSVSGCSDDFADERIDVRQEIMLSGGIVQHNSSRVNDAGFVAGDQMGVYIVDYQNEKPGTLMLYGNRANNYALTLSATSGCWGGSSSIYWKDNQTAIDVYGYYPYDNAMESVTEHIFTVQVDQSAKGGDGVMSGYEKSDFLWAKKTKVQPTEELIYLNFEHRLAGVKVVLQQGNGFSDEEWDKLERIVTIENTNLKSYINMNTGVATPIESNDKNIIAASQGDDIYRAVAIPQIVRGGKAFIGLTLDICYAMSCCM